LQEKKGEKMTHIMVHFELTSFFMEDMISLLQNVGVVH